MTLPVLGPSMIEGLPRRSLRAARAANASAFTGTEQVQDWSGRWWEYEITIEPTQGVTARQIGALFTRIIDEGKFLFVDPSACTPGNLGTPVVDGAGQTGKTLAVSGLAVGAPLVRAGAFLSVGSEAETRFHRIVADVTPDGSGDAVIEILPALRYSPADGAAVNIGAPRVVLRPVGQIPESVAAGDVHRFSFTAREAI